jgi:hypothetical protein
VTSPLASFVPITFRAVSGETPTAALPLDGSTFYFPPEYLTAIGSGAGNPGQIVAGSQSVRGYLQITAGPPIVREWMMTNELTAAVRAQVDAIPGGLGWVDQNARATVIQSGRDLRRLYGITAPDLVALLGTLYAAIVSNRNAQIAAGG